MSITYILQISNVFELNYKNCSTNNHQQKISNIEQLVDAFRFYYFCMPNKALQKRRSKKKKKKKKKHTARRNLNYPKYLL